MSLKGIELQIAIPKSFDAGKLADQKQQRVHAMQEHANLQTEKQVEKDKETVLETAHSEEINPDEKSEQEKEQRNERENSARNQEREEESEHPYKGSFVDFSR